MLFVMINRRCRVSNIPDISYSILVVLCGACLAFFPSIVYSLFIVKIQIFYREMNCVYFFFAALTEMKVAVLSAVYFKFILPRGSEFK